MNNTVGFTNTKKFICLEDLEQLYDTRLASSLHLSYCGREKCDPGYSFGPYIRNNYVIHVVTAGKGRYKTDIGEYLVETGEMFVIYPGETTYYEADTDDPWSYMWIGFNGTKARSVVEEIGFSKSRPVVMMGDISNISIAIDRMLEARELNYIDAMRRMSALYECLAYMMETNEHGRTRVQTSNERYVNAAIEYIASKFNENIKISEIALKVGINRSYLTSIFKKLTNMSPQEYLITFRLERAAQMLRETSDPIGDIASAVGYTDPLTFSKAFRKKYSMTPTEYRKNDIELKMTNAKGDYTGANRL